MAWLLFHLHGYQDGNGWGSSRTWDHAAVSYCKYGKPCNPLVCCFDLCTAFWHCFCLACSPGRLACKLPYFLCGAQKIVARGQSSSISMISCSGEVLFLRKFKARTPDALPNAIQCAFQAVSPSDCSGWFKSCDYLHYRNFQKECLSTQHICLCRVRKKGAR